MTFNDPTFRKDALSLVQKIVLDDIKKLNEGKYFGENLFIGYLELLGQLNKVAIETTKKFSTIKTEEIPLWAKANQNTRKVQVLPQPSWDGQ